MPDATTKKRRPCVQIVKRAPLEVFQTTRSRKWKQAARSLQAYMTHLATFANDDGTFTRNGKNYSPSHATLCKRFASGSMHTYETQANLLGILSWTRADHYARRVFTIHVDVLEKHSQDSSENTLNIGENTLNIREEHSQDSQKTLSATETFRGVSVGNQPTNPPESADGGRVGSDEEQDQEQDMAEEEGDGPAWTEEDERNYQEHKRMPFLKALKEYPLPDHIRSGITPTAIDKAYADVRHALKGGKYQHESHRLTQRAWLRFLAGRDFGGLKKTTAWKLFATELLTDWLRLAVRDLREGRIPRAA